MVSVVRFEFRDHAPLVWTMVRSATVSDLIDRADAHLRPGYVISRISYVDAAHPASAEDLTPDMPWTLRQTVLDPQPVVIRVEEFLLRNSPELVQWLLNQPGILTATNELVQAGGSRAIVEIESVATSDEFMTSWLPMTRDQQAATLALLGTTIGLPAGSQLMLVEPDLFVRQPRFTQLAQLARLTPGAALHNVTNVVDAFTFDADFQAIAYGEQAMASLHTDNGRILLHQYANVPLPVDLQERLNRLAAGAAYGK